MYGNVRFMHCVTAIEGDIRRISDVPSDCHVKYGLHSVVKTVWMLFADAVLIKIRAAMPAHIASPYFDLIIRHLTSCLCRKWCISGGCNTANGYSLLCPKSWVPNPGLTIGRMKDLTSVSRMMLMVNAKADKVLTEKTCEHVSC